ncbi:hypothetical protein [Acetoanaerobium noterae]|uniref:hypothetical protein n=1 Tax=Acetoanaerobium noterae TaxID=745369 RepID=UPI00331AB805
MKLLKSLSVLILFLSIIIVNIGTSYASERYPYEDYLKNMNAGYISEDVTFDELIGPDNMTFENMIEFTESNPNFTKIYESDNMDSNATYQITNSLSDTSKTYSSKIVYQAYRYGAGKESINEILFDIVRPYDLPKWIKSGQHGEYNTYE